MGSKKLATLLRQGKISQSEYNSRLAQSQDDKKLTSQLAKPERRQVKNVRKLAIPAYKQDQLMQLAASGQSSLVRKYLACLTAPKYNMCRVPDSDPRATALVRSIQVFDINCSTTDNSNGRFGFFIQPILGSVSSISDYKIGVVAPSAWGADFTNPANWLTSIGGQDPRVDSFSPSLTQPQNGFWNVETTGGTPAAPFSGTQVYDTRNYNYGQIYNPTSNVFFPPPGLYAFSGEVNGVGITALTFTGFQGAVIFQDGLHFSADHTLISFLAIVVISQPGQYFNVVAAATGIVGCQASIAPMYTANNIDPIYPPMDYGPVTSIRPVAMSALASYIGPLLTNGGNIAGAWLPSQSLNAQIITNVAGGGSQQNLMYWESLAKVPESYDGPIKDGSYVWWSEQDITNTKFYSPSASLAVDYPILAVSGQWNPGSAVSSAATIRLEVVTVLEFTTNSLLWESEHCVGSVAEMDSTNKMLAGQAHAMPNGKHMDWIKSMIGKASGAYKNNKTWIDPLAKTLGTLALTAL